MLNLLSRIKFYNGRFSYVGSFSSADKFSLIQLNRFSSSAANSPKPKSETSNKDSFIATYLKDKCGLSPENAVMYSKHLSCESRQKPDSVIAFFKNHHFTDAQISVIARKWPYLFRYIPETSYRPKIEFLRSFGFSRSHIVKIFTLAPDLLARSLEGQIIPCVDSLGSFLLSDKDVMVSILRYPGIIRRNVYDILYPNVEILRGAGVPESHIAAFLKNSARRIAVEPERFRVTVQEVQKQDLNPRKKFFITGIILMRQLSSSTWKEKINHYESSGWSEQQVLDAFRKCPHFMTVSQDKITRIMDFFTNKMDCDFSLLMRQQVICH